MLNNKPRTKGIKRSFVISTVKTWAWAKPACHHLSCVASGEMAFCHKPSFFLCLHWEGIRHPETHIHLFSVNSLICSANFATPHLSSGSPVLPFLPWCLTAKLPTSCKVAATPEKPGRQMSLGAFTLDDTPHPLPACSQRLSAQGSRQVNSYRHLSKGEISLKNIFFSPGFHWFPPIFLMG